MSEKKEPESPPVEAVNLSEQDLLAVRGQVPYKVWLVQGLYFLERAAFYGLSQPLRVSHPVYDLRVLASGLTKVQQRITSSCLRMTLFAQELLVSGRQERC